MVAHGAVDLDAFVARGAVEEKVAAHVHGAEESCFWFDVEVSAHGHFSRHGGASADPEVALHIERFAQSRVRWDLDRQLAPFSSYGQG